jgi:hypothetical protein
MRAGVAGETRTGLEQRSGPLNDEETTLGETRRYRKFSAWQKLGW